MTLFILILVVTAICSILYVLINEHNNLMRKVKKMKSDMDDIWSIIYDQNEKLEKWHAQLEKDHYIHMSDMNHVSKRIMDLERSRDFNNSFNDQESKGEKQ